MPQRKIGFTNNSNAQADSLIINNGTSGNTIKFTYAGDSSINFKLPTADGLNGYALKTDGHGNLSFGVVVTNATSGTSGTSGVSIQGQNGSSGTSGVSGSSGTSGVNGQNGTSGVNGATGPAGSGGGMTYSFYTTPLNSLYRPFVSDTMISSYNAGFVVPFEYYSINGSTLYQNQMYISPIVLEPGLTIRDMFYLNGGTNTISLGIYDAAWDDVNRIYQPNNLIKTFVTGLTNSGANGMKILSGIGFTVPSARNGLFYMGYLSTSGSAGLSPVVSTNYKGTYYYNISSVQVTGYILQGLSSLPTTITSTMLQTTGLTTSVAYPNLYGFRA